MPRIDGLQVLAIVRRRFPELRTVVLSALEDEEFRSRAYALGVDLFWLKTEMQRNSKCLWNVSNRFSVVTVDGGFRGIQSKSLMDIIQMECLSRSSTVLRITRGPLVAKMWIQDGELIDAEAEGARGEAAFRGFSPGNPARLKIFPPNPTVSAPSQKPVNALLLESAQAMDESSGGPSNPNPSKQTAHRKTIWKLALLTREGAEFVVAVPPEGQGEPEALGTQSQSPSSSPLDAPRRRNRPPARRTHRRRPLSYMWPANNLERQRADVGRAKTKHFWSAGRRTPPTELLEKIKKIVASWDS